MKVSVHEPVKPQFRCCCMPITIACKILAVFELLYVCIHLSDTVYVMISSHKFSFVYCISVLTLLALITFAIIAMWLGLNWRRPVLIFPHLVIQVKCVFIHNSKLLLTSDVDHTLLPRAIWRTSRRWYFGRKRISHYCQQQFTHSTRRDYRQAAG